MSTSKLQIDDIIKVHSQRNHNTYEFLSYLQPGQFKQWRLLVRKDNLHSYVHFNNKNFALRIYGFSTREIKDNCLYHISISVKVRNRLRSSGHLAPSDPVGAQITIRDKENSRDFDSLPELCFSIFNYDRFTNYYDFDNTLALIILKSDPIKYRPTSQVIHIFNPILDSYLDPNNAKISKKPIVHNFLTYIDPKICNSLSLLSLNKLGAIYCFNNNSKIKIHSYVGDLTDRFYDQAPFFCRFKIKPSYFIHNSRKLFFYDSVDLSFHNPDQSRGDFKNLKYRILSISALSKRIHFFDKKRDKYLAYALLMYNSDKNLKEPAIHFIKLSSPTLENIIKDQYSYINNLARSTWIHYF